jgi:hypothetical protein
LERKKLSIYANDRNEPTIIVTYRVKKKEEVGNKTKKNNREIDKFRVWVRDDKAEDFEILNYANLLFYSVNVFNECEPSEKFIFRMYQQIAYGKMWENVKLHIEEVQSDKAFGIKPDRNFVPFTSTTMQNFAYDQMIRFSRQANQLLEKE